MFYFTRREQLAVVVLLALALSGLGVFLYKAGYKAGASRNVPLLVEKGPVKPEIAGEIMVHVAGAVNKPGVYRLDKDSRVLDAIKLAGGHKSSAYLDALNLARFLEDGERVYVPTKAEVEIFGEEIVSSGVGKSGFERSVGSSSKISSPFVKKLISPKQGKININTANVVELQRLPGIGLGFARRIVQYREVNGPFKSIEEIKDVPGIGEGKFAVLKDFIEVK